MKKWKGNRKSAPTGRPVAGLYQRLVSRRQGYPFPVPPSEAGLPTYLYVPDVYATARARLAATLREQRTISPPRSIGPPPDRRGATMDKTPPSVRRAMRQMGIAIAIKEDTREPSSTAVEPIVQIATTSSAVNAMQTSQVMPKTRGVYFGELDMVPWDCNLDPPPRVCFFCWSRDHEWRDCQWVVEACCLNCGRRGVWISSCPRCKNRWLELQGAATQVGSRLWKLAGQERMLHQRLASISRRTLRSNSAPSRETASQVNEPLAIDLPRDVRSPMRERSNDLAQAIRLAELLASMTPETIRLYQELNTNQP